MNTRVLLIEDDPVSQDLLRALCESRGLAVDVATDGFAGLRRLRERSYSLALVDYHLPEMDGYALARLMRDLTSHDPEPLKLVGITADRHGLASRRGADALFDAILAKPLAAKDLFAAIDRLRGAAPDSARGAADQLLQSPDLERARAAAEAFWRHRGLAGRPKVLVCPEPTDEEARALRHCFDAIHDPHAADLILLLGAGALPALAELRSKSPAVLLPTVDLTGALAAESQASFRVDDPQSWTEVAATVLAFRRRREQLGPEARHAAEPHRRVLAHLFVRAPAGAVGSALVARLPLPESFPDALGAEGVARLAREGLIAPVPDGRAEITGEGVAALTANAGAVDATTVSIGRTLEHLFQAAPGGFAGFAEAIGGGTTPFDLTAEAEADHLATLRRLFVESLRAAAVDGLDASGLMGHESMRALLQAELRRARAKAKDAEEAKRTFLDLVSHELRTPLNGVLGQTDLLLDDPGCPPEQRGGLRRIRAAGRTLLAAIDDILDFVRLESGGIELAAGPVAPAALLDEVLGLVGEQAAAKGLTLRCIVDQDVPDTVLADVDRLRQVLLGLVGNAVRFTASGTVSVQVVLPKGEERLLRFVVEDTGPGFSQEQVRHMFEPFRPGNVTVRRAQGGLGLGLALGQRLVHLMGGSINLDRRTGGGTRAWFEIPLALGDEGVASPPLPLQPARVLLVDDVEINRDIARTILERAGHLVVMAPDGAAAVEAARSGRFDLVFMDLQMPVMDGLTAAERIQDLARAGAIAPVPIVALTANASPERDGLIQAAGLTGVVRKPFRKEELLDAVGRWRAPNPRTCTPSATEPASPVLDRMVFDEVAQLLGRPRLDVLVSQFKDELVDAFQGLGGEGERRVRLEREAHTMISSAGMLGFVTLSNLCRKLEEDASSAPGFERSLGEVCRERDRVLATLVELRAAA